MQSKSKIKFIRGITSSLETIIYNRTRSTEMMDSHPNQEENINDFWDAIQEIVNSEYVETPSPNTHENEGESNNQQASFTFDLLQTDLNPFLAFTEDQKKMEEQQKFMDSVFQQQSPQPKAEETAPNTLFTPKVEPTTAVSQESMTSPLVLNLTNESELAYLKAMLQSDVPLTTYTNHVRSQPMESDDEEEDDDHLMENIIVDSEIDVKVEDFGSTSCEQLLEEDYNQTNHGVTDDQLVSLSVRDLNKLLRNYPKDQKTELKQRRRLLKNRGYAQNCRNRRLSLQREFCEENKKLREMLEEITIERNLYKTKYENLKSVIRKAKIERERRKGLEDGVDAI